MQLSFDSHGWWSQSTLAKLRKLRSEGDNPGWYGCTEPPEQTPFFVSGASNADEAISQGMPIAAARAGRSTKPSALLD